MNKYLATLTWKVGSSCDQQLLRLFLREHCQISKRALADIKFNGGKILVNGNEVTVRHIVKEEDEVTILLPTEKISESLVPEHLDLSILYEDEHILVIDKRAGMPTIPSREHPSKTLANAVVGYYQRKGIRATFHAVNRLDRETSGLLLVAKHRLAHDRLSKLQQEGQVNRYYLALVEGLISEDAGIINQPIGRSETSIIKREVRSDGKRAITHFAVEERFANATLVKIKLETGRTHQIRVHFSFLRHPLLGDELYGGEMKHIDRQALHCFQVTFLHPFTMEKLSYTTNLPDDIRTAIHLEQ